MRVRSLLAGLALVLSLLTAIPGASAASPECQGTVDVTCCSPTWPDCEEPCLVYAAKVCAGVYGLEKVCSQVPEVCIFR